MVVVLLSPGDARYFFFLSCVFGIGNVPWVEAEEDPEELLNRIGQKPILSRVLEAELLQDVVGANRLDPVTYKNVVLRIYKSALICATL